MHSKVYKVAAVDTGGGRRVTCPWQSGDTDIPFPTTPGLCQLIRIIPYMASLGVSPFIRVHYHPSPIVL